MNILIRHKGNKERDRQYIIGRLLHAGRAYCQLQPIALSGKVKWLVQVVDCVITRFLIHNKQ